jgi:transmembrane sensor
MKYLHYTTEDFVLDEDFQQWVQHPDPERDTFWQAFLREHPHKQAAVTEARNLIQSLQFKRSTPTVEEYQQVLRGIYAGETKRNERVLGRETSRRPWYGQTWFRVAAVFFLVGLSAVLYLAVLPRLTTVTHTTAYGEKRRIILPDSSVVTLNANSTLRYGRTWREDQAREVWLQGEAFFDVKPQPSATQEKPSARFIVHTDALGVEVLGTTFNVRQRRDRTQVVLNTGKVRLINLEVDNDPDEDTLLMQPGEMVEYSETEHRIIKTSVDPGVYSAWRQNQLIFQGTSIRNIATILEDTYGMNVVIADSALAETRFTATIPAERLDVLLEILSELLGVPVTQERNRIIIGNRTR